MTKGKRSNDVIYMVIFLTKKVVFSIFVKEIVDNTNFFFFLLITKGILYRTTYVE